MKGFVPVLWFQIKKTKNKTPKQIPEIIKFQIGFSNKEVIRPSEDSAWQLLAEHAIKVQLPAHQIILYILKRPLMVSQFQCLPLSLKIKNKQHMKFPKPHATNPNPSVVNSTNYRHKYFESFICICRHGHGSTAHLLLHDPWLVCACGHSVTKQTQSVCGHFH